MSRTKRLSFDEAFDKLSTQHERGKKPKAPPGPYLVASSIKLWPDVFQHRLVSEHVSNAHVRELAKHASQPRGLQPITVWWDGKNWACVDGHHRIKAYRLASMAEHPVPVEVFEGTPSQAVVAAARLNTQDKLAMSLTEKTNAAWRLVLVGGLSKADTSAFSGASLRTVANMRRVMEALNARGVNCAAMGWEAARRLERGEAYLDEEEQEDKDEKLARELAASVSKAIGRRGSQQVQAFARALELYDPRMPQMLMEWWGSTDDE